MSNHRDRNQRGFRPQPQRQEQRIHINPNIIKPVLCECGNLTFLPASKLGITSAIISPTGKAMLHNFTTYVCSNCGKELTHSRLEGYINGGTDERKDIQANNASEERGIISEGNDNPDNPSDEVA